MPDSAGRLKRSEMEVMSSILLSLTSLYEETDVQNHPRMCVIFNDVSKSSSDRKKKPTYLNSSQAMEDETEVQVNPLKYIAVYKYMLIEVLREYYDDKLD